MAVAGKATWLALMLESHRATGPTVNDILQVLSMHIQ